MCKKRIFQVGKRVSSISRHRENERIEALFSRFKIMGKGISLERFETPHGRI